MDFGDAFSYITDTGNWKAFLPNLVRLHDPTQAKWDTPVDKVTVVIQWLSRDVQVRTSTGVAGHGRSGGTTSPSWRYATVPGSQLPASPGPISAELVPVKWVNLTSTHLCEVLSGVARARLPAPTDGAAQRLRSAQPGRGGSAQLNSTIECRPGISSYPIRADCTPRRAPESFESRSVAGARSPSLRGAGASTRGTSSP